MDIFDEIAAFGVIPVIALDEAEAALPLADALIAGGLPVAEITFRTGAARAAIAAIAAHRPTMLVGAGTVLDPDQADEAAEAGARFALAPGLDEEVLARAAARALPFAPGIQTASELTRALRAGCGMVKFFPAAQAGGPAALAALAGPFAHTGIGFNPTGGVTLQTMGEWRALPMVRAVGGTWIATREQIAAGDWEGIAERAREAVARAR
ncbi:MAG: bifunctional 4-hydroxy-2-oxoglutarate aldolase/2-dehydro-3-deoxy-phosphogluconate aldolase [Paracoccaceae bacterium]|jgi:2-dehydro-3-deoxyphosphogluconate aldolase/(4S)-4-hydroxy-2-oxoglutarate aldolase|nr:bifunctional 4-hydroxy-2-oxoglutarate aldolase/2-dehydro-3-deoxy-phosphogluconate aldolase [Paracoccaceae bacterium]